MEGVHRRGWSRSGGSGRMGRRGRRGRGLAAGLAIAALALGTGTGLAACASSGGGQDESAGSAERAAPRGMPAPSGHPLARVQEGMNPGQVSEILGQPTSQQTYQTGKAWIPFYWGSDTQRTDWKYQGTGRVVFGTNRWSGNQKVIRIDYDPAEDGY